MSGSTPLGGASAAAGITPGTGYATQSEGADLSVRQDTRLSDIQPAKEEPKPTVNVFAQKSMRQHFFSVEALPKIGAALAFTAMGGSLLAACPPAGLAIIVVGIVSCVGWNAMDAHHASTNPTKEQPPFDWTNNLGIMDYFDDHARDDNDYDIGGYGNDYDYGGYDWS